MTTTAPKSESDEAVKPLLLFFYSPTEGHSRRVEAYLAQVLQRRRNHEAFRIRHIDVGERPDLGQRFHVSSLPTLLVVSDQRVRARVDRPRGPKEIKQTLEPWLRG